MNTEDLIQRVAKAITLDIDRDTIYTTILVETQPETAYLIYTAGKLLAKERIENAT